MKEEEEKREKDKETETETQRGRERDSPETFVTDKKDGWKVCEQYMFADTNTRIFLYFLIRLFS